MRLMTRAVTTSDRAWIVVGPQREYGGRIYGDSPEPPEYGCLWVEVTAPTRAAALREATHTNKDARELAIEARGDRRHPYSYMRAIVASPDGLHCVDDVPDDVDEPPLCTACARQERSASLAIERLTERFG